MKSRPNGGGGACRLELAGRATDRWALGAASAAGRPGAGSNSGAVNLGTERMSEALGETTRNQRRRRAGRQAGRLDQPPRWEHCPAPGAGSSHPAAGPAVQAAVRGVCMHVPARVHVASVCTRVPCMRGHVCTHLCSPPSVSARFAPGPPQTPKPGRPEPLTACVAPAHGLRWRAGHRRVCPHTTHHSFARIRQLLGTRRIQVSFFENVWDFFS